MIEEASEFWSARSGAWLLKIPKMGHQETLRSLKLGYSFGMIIYAVYRRVDFGHRINVG
jgi:hypothetical protein